MGRSSRVVHPSTTSLRPSLRPWTSRNDQLPSSSTTSVPEKTTTVQGHGVRGHPLCGVRTPPRRDGWWGFNGYYVHEWTGIRQEGGVRRTEGGRIRGGGRCSRRGSGPRVKGDKKLTDGETDWGRDWNSFEWIRDRKRKVMTKVSRVGPVSYLILHTLGRSFLHKQD